MSGGPAPRGWFHVARLYLLAFSGGALLLALFIASMAAAENHEAAMSTQPSPSRALAMAADNWMGRLPDTRSLGSLSIPGAHDSAARFGLYLCQTQSWTIAGLLDAGIRYLDIRARGEGDILQIYHGLCFQRMSFGDVLTSANGFLARHPREALIMRVHDEDTPAGARPSFQAIWAKYMASGGQRFVGEIARIPTLGEMRGKALVLRDAAFGGYGLAFKSERIRLQDSWQVYPSTFPNPYGGATVSVGQKLQLIHAHILDAMQNNREGGALYLNHLSGSDGVSPAEFAARANPDALQFLRAHPDWRSLGVLIMDYPGEDLIERILQANFNG